MVIVCVRVTVEAGAVLGLWLRLGFGGRVDAGIRVQILTLTISSTLTPTPTPPPA